MIDKTRDPISAKAPIKEASDRQESAVFVASQWQLMWWKFRRHRLAVISAVILSAIYLIALFAEFVAPGLPRTSSSKYTYAPPQPIHLFVRNQEGIKLIPHVLGYESRVDPESARRIFTVDPSQVIPIGFFVQGEPYEWLGLVPTDRHFIGPLEEHQPMFLFGADRLGRDVLSRFIYGTRTSMTIGLAGVALSLVLGVVLGGISGYYGGWIDNLMQRLIELIVSIPSIPLWLGFSAAMPKYWSATQVYFAITIILSLRGWTSLGRVVRGRFLSMRQEEFVMAARLDGSGELRIILVHMLPSFFSHIIAAVTLAIPNMIISETALSFLGLGLRPPAVSWGVLLQGAQNVRALTQAPWLLIPAGGVIIAVLTLNIVGDGLRDAADPYAV